MTNTFVKLFSVHVLHSYFENGYCHDLEFKPGKELSIFLQRFGLMIHVTPKGFDFYAKSSESLETVIDNLKQSLESTYFDFNIKVHDTSFFNYTELPLNWNHHLFYSSDSELNITTGHSQQLVHSLINLEDSSNLMSLRINFDDLLQLHNAEDEIVFEIIFDARATQWKYFIINKSEIDLARAIISGSTNITFNGPEQVQTANGEDALSFSSGESRIPLSERSKFTFDLIVPSNTGNKPSKVIFKGLPLPSIDALEVKQVEGKNEVSSLMYIYV